MTLWCRNFLEATRILFVLKENKNNDFIQQYVSSVSPYSAILESITYVNNICCSVSAALYADTSSFLFSLRSKSIIVAL